MRDAEKNEEGQTAKIKFRRNLEKGESWGGGGQIKNILFWAPNDASLQTMKPKFHPFICTHSEAASDT